MQKNLKQKIFKKSSPNELLCQALAGGMDGIILRDINLCLSVLVRF